MKYKKHIDVLISDTEREIAKYKFVQSHFPDAQTFWEYVKPNRWQYGFQSKLANQNYTNTEFHNWNNFHLYFTPYYKLEFNYNGLTETINVHSSPRKIRLAYIDYAMPSKKSKGDTQHIECIKFSKYLKSLKKNDFSEACLNDIVIQIIHFITANPKSKLVTDNLDPRIKKLLVFS